MALRPVVAADRAFLLELFASTRTRELAALDPQIRQAFVEQQFAVQDAQYRAQQPVPTHDLVLLDDRPAGQLRVSRSAEEIRLVDVSLLPDCRGHGVGSRLLGGLQDEARATGVPLTLSVLEHSPARRLYARLGFAETAARRPYVAMAWAPRR